MARYILSLCLLLVLSSCEMQEDSLAGRIVAIADGDTVTLLTAAQRQVKIRLDQIDAPERGQPWSQNSRRLLEKLLKAGPIRVQAGGVDRYGRTIGRIYAGRVDVNMGMVEAGGAWAYTEYLRDGAFRDAENRARKAKRGLWSMPPAQTVPPWTYRSERRRRPRPDAPLPTPAPVTVKAEQSFACGEKRYCGQMTSCAEAISYLRQCGLERLDGDGDGMPCETICLSGR